MITLRYGRECLQALPDEASGSELAGHEFDPPSGGVLIDLHTLYKAKAGAENVQDDQPCARDASEHTQAGACNFDYKPHEDSVPRDRMP